jgi:3-phenylpropionate/cinnamic acid dioxygenase small subunit
MGKFLSHGKISIIFQMMIPKLRIHKKKHSICIAPSSSGKHRVSSLRCHHLEINFLQQKFNPEEYHSQIFSFPSYYNFISYRKKNNTGNPSDLRISNHTITIS